MKSILLQSEYKKRYELCTQRRPDEHDSVSLHAVRTKTANLTSVLSMSPILAFMLVLVHVPACSQTPRIIDPKASYILTNSDPDATPAIAISLTSLGITPGDTIQIKTQGDYSFCFPTGCPEIQVPACGVFSSNTTLLPANNANRVVGAKPVTDGVVSPCVTGPTLYGQIPTDIPEDFVLDGASMRVPSGAHYFFVAVPDIFYGDNLDPNGDLAIVAQRTLIPLTLNILYRVNVDGTDRMTTTGPPETDFFPLEGQLYYIPSYPLGKRSATLNRFNNGPDHRDSALVEVAGYFNEGPLGFPWTNNVLPGVGPMAEGFNANTSDYALMKPEEQLPGYVSTPLNVFGYPRFANQTESILSLSGGGVKIESNRASGGSLWRWTWNGKQFFSNLDSLRGSYDVLFLDGFTNYLNQNGDDCQNHSPLVKAQNNGSTQVTVSVPLANSFVFEGDDPCHHPVIWKDALVGKQITLNFRGMGPVAQYTTFMSLPADVRNVDLLHPISSLEAEFNRYFSYDAEHGDLQERFIADACEDAQAFSPNFGGVILSDQSGQFAMGTYAVNVSKGGSITGLALFRHVCNDGTYSRIDVVRTGDLPFGYSSYNSYFMTGTLQQVRGYMDVLFTAGVK
jgi:hypothetical protein